MVARSGITSRSLGFAVVSVGAALAIVSEYSLRPVEISVGAEFGFGSYMPIGFWIGLFLLLTGTYLVVRSGREIHSVLAILLLALVVWGIPVLGRELPYHTDSYWHMSDAKWIYENGQLTFSSFSTYTEKAYLQYPSLFIDSAVLKLVTVLDEIPIMNLFSMGVIIFFVLNFYILARVLSSSNERALIVTLIALVGNGAMFSNHFSPSAIGEALFPLMVALMLLQRKSPQNRTRLAYLLLLFPLTFLIVTLHPLTALLYLAVATSLLLFPARFTTDLKHKPRFDTILLIGVLFFAWGVFVATWGLTELGQSINRFLEVLNLERGSVLTTTVLERQTLLFPIVGWIKRVMFLAFAVPAVLFSGKSFYKREIRSDHVIFLSIFIAWLLSSVVTVLSDRLLVWIVPFAALVLLGNRSVVLVKSRSRRFLEIALLLSLFIMAPLTILTYHSGGAMYVTTRGEYAGYCFLAKNLRENELVYDHGTAATTFGSWFHELYYYMKTGANIIRVKSLSVATTAYFPIGYYAYCYYVEGNSSNSFTLELYRVENSSLWDLVYSSADFYTFRRNR